MEQKLKTFKAYLYERGPGEFFRIDYKSSSDKNKIIKILKKMKIEFEENKDEGFINPRVDVSSIRGQDLTAELEKQKIEF